VEDSMMVLWRAELAWFRHATQGS